MPIGSGVFDPRGSKNRGVPLTRLVALTTVLHYRADCDVVPSYIVYKAHASGARRVAPFLGEVPLETRHFTRRV